MGLFLLLMTCTYGIHFINKILCVWLQWCSQVTPLYIAHFSACCLQALAHPILPSGHWQHCSQKPVDSSEWMHFRGSVWDFLGTTEGKHMQQPAAHAALSRSWQWPTLFHVSFDFARQQMKMSYPKRPGRTILKPGELTLDLQVNLGLIKVDGLL